MKIKILGYTGGIKPTPTETVEKELIRLGCEVSDEPELLIEFCGLYEKAEEFYNKCNKKPVRLYNILDVNNTTPNFYNQAKIDYENCEIATTISKTVREQIREKFQTNREIHVINFPIRPVMFMKESARSLPFLYVGRWYDSNKKTHLIKPTLELLKRNPEFDLMVVGSEKPQFPCFFNKDVDDEILNIIYNGAEFLFLPSEKEGIGLSCVEATIGGCISLLNKNNITALELGLGDFTTDPTPQGLVSLIKAVQKNINYYWDKMDELRPIYQHQFSAKTVAKNILDLYNNYVEANGYRS